MTSSQYREGGSGRSDQMGWIVGCTVAALALFGAAGVARRTRPTWRYHQDGSPRDHRLDLLRGVIIVSVVITHIEVAGPLSFICLKAVGAITSAEMFVLLSGLAMGMVQRVLIARSGAGQANRKVLLRARKLYVTALVVTVLVYLVGLLPFVSARAITTFVDRGTGVAGQSTAGQVYDLYSTFPRLLDYPPPWYAVEQLLFLQMGPWVFNIMGLYVVLSLLVPAVLWMFRHRMWWLVIAVSWVTYVIGTTTHARLLPSQFEDVFPLLVWQVIFMHGLAIGYYRESLTRALTSTWGIRAVTTGDPALRRRTMHPVGR